MRLFGWGLACFVFCAFEAQTLGAQAGLRRQCDAPVWMDLWSPVALVGDTQTSLPSLQTCTPRLWWGPVIGLFLNGRNPAARVGDVKSTSATFAASWGRESGAYRRPLDPAAGMTTRLSALGWSSQEARQVLAGRAELEQERFDPGTRLDQYSGGSASPFVLTDTGTFPVRRIRARVEGSGSWRVGGVSVGLGAGYESRSSRTLEAPFTRSIGGTLAGATAGVLWSKEAWAVGVHARGRRRSEIASLNKVAAFGLVYDLKGYQDVSGSPVLADYSRWTQEYAWSLGPDLSWNGERLSGFVSGELTRLNLRQWRAELNDPPTDRWGTSGWNLTFGGSWRASHGLTVVGRTGFSHLTGMAREAENPTDTSFSATTNQFSTTLSLWVRPRTASGWVGVLTSTIRSETNRREDRVADLLTDISATAWSLELELADRFGPSEIGIRGGVLNYVPRARIPDPEIQSRVYQDLIAGEVALYSTGAWTWQALGFVRQRIGPGQAIWGTVGLERLAPLSSPVPPTTGASRTALGIRVGASLGAKNGPGQAP